MAFDGVLAFQGKDHITASQLGRIVEGVAGKGRYVLPTLNQMTAEMQTANKVRVGTGDLVMDGRVVTNEAAVDLTVESGTSGYKRNDLVVCRYAKNASTGVETFAAEVVKGTPTTGTAADPEVTEGDISAGSAAAVMPLWRIPLDGITPGAPVRIAPVASTLKTLGDSVSQDPNAVSVISAASWLYINGYVCSAGVVVGGNANPGNTITKGGDLCTITTDRQFTNAGSLLLRGAFPNKQPGIYAEYSNGNTIVLRAEQQVVLAACDTFSVVIPCMWAI